MVGVNVKTRSLCATPKIKKEYNMPKKDKIQARLTWLVLFLLSLDGIQRLKKIKPLSGILAAIVMVVFVLGLTYLNSVINDKIDELEEL